MARLTVENTNALAHRIAGDTLVYYCDRCEFGEVVVTDMIEEGRGACLECGTCYELHVTPADAE